MYSLIRCSVASMPQPSFINCPVEDASPGLRQFLMRNSSGDMPSLWANWSICDSWATAACITPKPRMAPETRLLV